MYEDNFRVNIKAVRGHRLSSVQFRTTDCWLSVKTESGNQPKRVVGRIVLISVSFIIYLCLCHVFSSLIPSVCPLVRLLLFFIRPSVSPFVVVFHSSVRLSVSPFVFVFHPSVGLFIGFLSCSWCCCCIGSV